MECFYIWPDLVSMTPNSLRCQKVLFEAPDSFADARLGGMDKKTGCVSTSNDILVVLRS